jgi:hypothetical protein
MFEEFESIRAFIFGIEIKIFLTPPFDKEPIKERGFKRCSKTCDSIIVSFPE